MTEAKFEHDVEDLVVRFWSKRYTEKTIVLFSKGKPKPQAYMGSKDTITFLEGEKVNILRNSLAKETKAPITNNAAIKESDEEIEKIFEVFYDVQNIPARRNKRLARHGVPKKFSNRFRMREGIKIEYGIQKTKLDSFVCDQLTNTKDKHKGEVNREKQKS